MQVSVRDLRAIDASFPRVLPQVLVRPHCFILKLEAVRAVITRDCVYVFDPMHPTVQSFLPALHDKFRVESDNGMPFELRVFEEVLVAVVCD